MNTITLFKIGSTWACACDNFFFGIFLSNTLSMGAMNNWRCKGEKMQMVISKHFDKYLLGFWKYVKISSFK